MAVIRTALDKPYFFFRPGQAVRRLSQTLRRDPGAGVRETQLPWKLPLRYRADEHIGGFIEHHGVYDLTVSEAAWRLLDTGETAIDAGANIGYVSSLLAARSGCSGTVVAFEPHPRLFDDLSRNAGLWRDTRRAATVVLFQAALADHVGTGTLTESAYFDGNAGTASLGPGAAGAGRSYSVPLLTLDECARELGSVGLLKIDVEGHEISVLRGARETLASGRCRDILFEDYGAPPTPVHELLGSYGYTIFALGRGFWGVRLMPPHSAVEDEGGPPSYLATLNPARAQSRLGRFGWAVLRGSRR